MTSPGHAASLCHWCHRKLFTTSWHQERLLQEEAAGRLPTHAILALRGNMFLEGQHIAILATDGFEESGLTEPLRALKDAGARVDVVSLNRGEIQAMRHHDKSIKLKVDRTLDELNAQSYDAV